MVTGRGNVTCQYLLDRFRVHPFFEVMECGAGEGSRKPEAMVLVTKTFALQTHEVLYVGDSPGDIQEIRKAGVAVVGAAWAATVDGKAI